jgi:alpha-L-rhamnosidase
MKTGRQFVPASGFAADRNILPGHPADAAAWVWHPARGLGETAFLRFTLDFDLPADTRTVVHVTADQRFQLQLDGEEIGYGPDRGTVEKWPVASYEVSLPRGPHRLEALVWWLPDETLAGRPAGSAAAPVHPPVAQATWRGGFLLAGEGEFAARLNTGTAPWRVADYTDAIRPVQKVFGVYHDIGPEFHVDGTGWTQLKPSEPVTVVVGPIAGNPNGVQRPGWRLHPATLPEQARYPVHRGRVRALAAAWEETAFTAAEPSRTETAGWTALIQGEGEIVIPPHGACTMLWDFQDYICGYARLTTAGGAGARVRIDWAEALQSGERGAKGRRDEIAGKNFVGFGDEFLPTAGTVDFPALWWRAGRYLRVQVRAGGEALVIKRLAVVATGYPLGEAANLAADQPALNHLMARCERTTRACAHEVWTDCPYYEQEAYVGDSRLAALINYAGFEDDRLSRRMIELFDDSRSGNGLVAERTPAAWPQVSVTYSLLWVLMVRDFAWWRDDVGFVRARLRGVRAMLDEVLALRQPDGLLRTVPGWPFVDWVPGWSEGCGPGVREGDSSIVNLHLLLALRAQEQLEKYCGEPELAALAGRRAAHLGEAILTRYWSVPRGLLADTGAFSSFSEHAQALGFLAGLVPLRGIQQWATAWGSATGLAPATVYFSFYVIEALRQAGRGDELFRRFADMAGQATDGLLTMPEAPEPTRSDCHGWSAHWRWHAAATLAGVRPAAPGFARVEVAPQFGELKTITAEVRHPHGLVKVTLQREGRHLGGSVELPEGVSGELRWHNDLHPLTPGKNAVDLGSR